MSVGKITFIPIARRQARPSAYGAFTDARIAALDLTRKAPTKIRIYGMPPTKATKDKGTFVYRYNGEPAPKGGNLIETHKWYNDTWVRM